MKKIINGYKWLTDNMESAHGSETPWEIGSWKKIDGSIEICKAGYHASENPFDSLAYNYGNRFFLVEATGTILRDNDKFVGSEMRLVQELPALQILREFVVACAKNCLYKFEKEYPGDIRPRKAIEVAEHLYDQAAAHADADDAYAAAYATDAAAAAAYAAAAAAYAAAYAAYAAAYAADAAAAAAYAAAYAAYAAAYAAYAAAAAASAAYAAYTDDIDAAHAAAQAEKRWQEAKLKKIIEKYSR